MKNIFFRTWLAAYSFNCLLFLSFFRDGSIAQAAVVFGLPASLAAIPLLYLFWDLFTGKRYSKTSVLIGSCLAAMVIAALGVIITVVVIEHGVRIRTLRGLGLFLYLPMAAALFSILINHKGIYAYTQRQKK